MKRGKFLLALGLALLVLPMQAVISQAQTATGASGNSSVNADNEKEPVSEVVHAPLFREGYLGDDMASPMLFTLNVWEDDLRAVVLEAIQNDELNIDVSAMGIATDEASAAIEVIRDVLDENTRYFYLTGYIRYWHYPSTGQITRFDIGVMDKYAADNGDGTVNCFEPDWELIRGDVAAYEEGVAAVLNHVKSGMTDLEKLLAMHDFIVRECEYDYDNYLAETVPEESYNAYGVFALDIAVCQGYAEAFVDLCNRVGIPSDIVTSSAMNHAWNLIQIDGNWYHMDATWDDPVGSAAEGYVSHDYFLYSDTEFEELKSHHGWDTDIPLASHSGAFEGYSFRDLYGDMYYYEGRWYYKDLYEWQGKIISSKIDGSDSRVEYTDADILEVHGESNVLYLAKDSGIFTITLPNFNVASSYYLCVNEQELSSPTLEEITVRNNALYCILEDSSDVRHIKWIPLLQASDSHSHVPQYVAGVPATCTANGTKAYYKCHCDKYFEDVDCTTEIINLDTWKVLALLGHSPNADDGDCTTAITCSECGEVTTEAETAHSGGTATCIAQAECENCGTAYGAYGAHTPNADDGDCTTAITCSLCGEVTTEAKATHTGGTATCSLQAKCTTCGKAYGEALAHTWNVEEATYKTDKHCIACGFVEQEMLVVVFYDVPEKDAWQNDNWQYKYAKYAVENSIMAGTGRGPGGSVVFSPDMVLSRAQFAQVLYNLEGATSKESGSRFSDVKDGEWYTYAVNWAAENRLVEGYNNGKYGTDDPITREQLAMILYKYADMRGFDTTGRADITKFADYEKTSGWAVEAIRWANHCGIINGKGANLDPGGFATRAECAAMIKNFMDRFGEI